MSEGGPGVVALAGPNGAGKTTAGPTLLRDTLGVRLVVNADTIATPALIAAGHGGEIDRLEDKRTWGTVLEAAGESDR